MPRRASSPVAVEWDGLGPRLWFLASSPINGPNVPPAMALSLLRKEDAIVVPASDSSTSEYVDFCMETLPVKPEQVISTGESTHYMLESRRGGGCEQIQRLAQDSSGSRWTVVVPKVTTAMSKWLPQLTEGGLRVFGAGPSLKPAPPANCLLHREASQPDEPSLLEELALGVPAVTGYICRNAAELLAMWELLVGGGDSASASTADKLASLLLRPVSSQSTGGGIMIISSKQELSMYDFPNGPVVLEARSESFEASSHVAIKVAFVQRELLQPMDVFRTSQHHTVSLRHSQQNADTLAKVSAACASLLASPLLAGHGSGALEFKKNSAGEPVLVSIDIGFELAHFPALFGKKWAPAQRMLCWSFTPAEDLDVWTVWYRLHDSGICFRPGKKKSKAGVFPLSFARQQRSYFVAVAKDDEQLNDIYERANAVLREPVVEAPLERVTLDDSERRIWCGSPRPEYRRMTQRYNLPTRCLPLIRKDRDFIILPGGYPGVKSMWEFVRDVYGLDDGQAIFTSGENLVMDLDVDDAIVQRIRGIVTSNSKDKFTIVPYCVTPQFEAWSRQLSELGVTVYGESVEWTEKFGHKGILHRHMACLDTPCLMEEIAPHVQVAAGYTCSTPEQLLEAYRLLDCAEVVIKPVYGAAGEGIEFVTSAERLAAYDFPMGDVCLEEMLDLDRAEDGVVLSPAVHYFGPSLVGKSCVDQIMVGTGYAGWRKSQAPKSFQAICVRSIRHIIKAMNPLGPGGFDFLSSGGTPLLSDVNTGRFNGAHFPKLFVEMYAPGQSMFCWKFKPPVGLSVQTFWSRITSRDVAFVPGEVTTGVFPLLFLPGLSGLFIAVAPTDEEAKVLYQQALPCLALKLGPSEEPKKEAVVQRPQTSTMSMLLIKNASSVYTPDFSDHKHLLVGGGQVVALLTDEDATAMERLLEGGSGTVIDATNLIVTPGFVDGHVHVTGGGGEEGPSSRTPELAVSQLINAGITTCIGLTGTDSVSRTMENLLTKVRGLREEGVSAYMLSGAYRLPTPTITGSVLKDICLIEQCIGVGEIAISDHRGSQPTVHALETLGSEARVGGMLSGKAGVVHCHMGTGSAGLSDLFKAVKNTDLPITVFQPTHMSRNDQLVEEGIQWIKAGGYVDFTACSRKRTIKALLLYYAKGVNLDMVTVSSDAGGSCPSFDAKGELIKYGQISPNGLMNILKTMAIDMQWPLSRVLPLMSRNVARVLKLDLKGEISVGKDADLLLLDAQTLDIVYVVAGGKVVKSPGFVQKSLFGL